jgi:hypothetical protein
MIADRTDEPRLLLGNNRMIRALSAKLRVGAVIAVASAAWQFGLGSAAWAQQAGSTPAAETPASTAMTTPSLTGPLVANPDPWSFDSAAGKIYVTGAFSGLAMVQGNPVGTDRTSRLDLSNGFVMVQKTEGLLQFFVQAGGYALPSLGSPYISVERGVGDFFGPVPVAYGKLAPTDEFSLQVGKLPTLIGAEYTFTFQNMNIERGLLWNQEPAISRGVQANYTLGPVAFSLSLNDGFYSGRYNWVTGSAAWTVDKINTLSVVGGGNVDKTFKSSLATPLAQNNSTILNLIYTYNNAPWTITPYFQYTNVPKDFSLGFGHEASTYGGAILANYSVNDNVNVAGRAEYISSTGSLTNGAPSLLYGPGSSAWSVTFTPTYQEGIFFVREELSYVQAISITPGFAFGRSGGAHSQARVMIEGGVVF